MQNVTKCPGKGSPASPTDVPVDDKDLVVVLEEGMDAPGVPREDDLDDDLTIPVSYGSCGRKRDTALAATEEQYCGPTSEDYGLEVVYASKKGESEVLLADQMASSESREPW